MGGGSYSTDDRYTRAMSIGYYDKPKEEIFENKSINNAMSPHGVKMRESRDSDEHPNSLAIIIGLDVTGSMGSIPHHLVRDGFPNIMDSILQSGEKDPQVLFMGIGDHEYDSAPLQIGQFESSDELLDKWLTDIYLEGGGGGNYGESYLLAWYFAAYHTSIDCFEKRGRKGYLFTIGDEPCLNEISSRELGGIMGNSQAPEYSAKGLLEKAREKYNVYHIHVLETVSGIMIDRRNYWRSLIGDNLLLAQRHEEISQIIPSVIQKENSEGATSNNLENPEELKKPKDPEIIL